ncbi:MAG: amidohydrolase family protein [Gemmatimonadetes bacterium]|nr:amidohydrolase family protein [Gemmatimonadota bacterium]
MAGRGRSRPARILPRGQSFDLPAGFRVAAGAGHEAGRFPGPGIAGGSDRAADAHHGRSDRPVAGTGRGRRAFPLPLRLDVRAACYLASWVLPVAGAPLRDAGVLVGPDGRIVAVGPRAQLPAGEAIDRVDLGAAILLPGLVNVHAHAELAAFRGLLEDLPFPRWITTLRRCKQEAAATPAELRAAALLTCAESLAVGITTFGATEDSDAAAAALRETGMRGVIFREVFGPDPQQASAALQELVQHLDALQSEAGELVQVGVSPHAPYTVSDELYGLVARLAERRQLPVAVHAAEAEAEASLVVRGEGPFAAGLRARGLATPPRARSIVALLERTGILALRPLVIHAVRVGAEDRGLLAAAGASVAHCPTANARLGHGVAPVVELRAAGVNVALGTDSVASNNRLDLLEEARTAQLLQRARLASASALPACELLEMVTLAGARALGLADRIGSLEPGKDADLCAVAIDRPHTEPAHDPLATLFHAARGSDVVLTVVRGRVLYRAGRLLTIDPADTRATLHALAARLAAARGTSR